MKNSTKAKSENRKMQKKVTVRFDDETYNFLDESSKKLGLTKPDLVRNLVLNRQIKQSKVMTMSRDEAEDFLQNIVLLTNEINSVQTDLKRIGNNINQIAKKTNSDGWKSSYDSFFRELDNVLNGILEDAWKYVEVNKNGYKQRKSSRDLSSAIWYMSSDKAHDGSSNRYISSRFVNCTEYGAIQQTKAVREYFGKDKNVHGLTFVFRSVIRKSVCLTVISRAYHGSSDRSSERTFSKSADWAICPS